MAVGALPPLVEGPERSAVELQRRAARDQGYMLLLLGATLVGGGVLVTLLRSLVFGGVVALAGVGSIIAGAWLSWRGAGMLER